MISTPLSDLAAGIAQRRAISDVRARLETSGEELASGRKRDLFAASGRDPSRLFAIEREQALAATNAEGLSIAAGRLTAVQASLGKMQSLAGTLGVELEASVARGDLPSARIQAAGAEEGLRNVVQALNGAFAGRSLFAGAAVDGPALAPADAILAEVGALLAAAPDAAAGIAAVDAWFADPVAGYSAAYLGAVADAPEAGLGDGATAQIAVRADADEVRTLVKGLALAAATVSPAYAGPPDAVADLLAAAAGASLQARDDVVSLRAGLGLIEGRVEEASAAVAGRRNALDLAWNAATQRDPYEAAAEFQALEQQLEMTFAVTARLSRLSLNDFLR